MELLLEELKEKKDAKGNVTLHHPETGEPLFNVTPSRYGREVTYRWHPHMLASHPELQDSWEHNKIPKKQGDSKSHARSISDAHYQNAARAGFKDKLQTKVSYVDQTELDNSLSTKMQKQGYDPARIDSHYGDAAGRKENYGKIHTFHDPDTGEVISTHTYDVQKGDEHHTINSTYLDKHNLTDSWETLAAQAKKETPYTHGASAAYMVAKKLHENKGKQPRLSGIEMNKNGYTSYKVNTTPEDGSAAHEEFVKRRYEKAEITRHSPTAFTAIVHPESEHYSGNIINSHISGNVLHSTVNSFHHPDYRYKDSNTHIIEGAETMESTEII